MNNEKKWRTIPGFSNYECSDQGDIRNINTKQMLNPTQDEKGYLIITIGNDDNKKKTISTHILVATTWIENPDEKETVDHINRIRNDNRVVNLRWATHKEQAANRAPIKNNSRKGVWKCDINTGEKLKFYKSVKEAAIIEFNDENKSGGIIQCAIGKSKSSQGFKWSYDKIEDQEGEIWKFYKTHKRHNYYISNFGRVKNNNNLLKTKDDRGYRAISVNKKHLLVHILVAKLFIDNPNPDTYNKVNHKDGNRSNNNVSNLEWLTNQENCIHAINTGLKKSVKKIVNYDKEGKIIKIYNSCVEAAKFCNMDSSSVRNCCQNLTKSCKGLFFKYLDDTDDLNSMTIDIKNMENRVIIKENRKSIIGKVEVCNKNNESIEICDSITIAARKYNVSIDAIRDQLNKNCKFTKLNYIFKYPDVIQNV